MTALKVIEICFWSAFMLLASRGFWVTYKVGKVNSKMRWCYVWDFLYLAVAALGLTIAVIS